MITYVDHNGEGYTDEEATLALMKHLDIPEMGFKLISIEEAVANGQSVVLARDVDQLVDPEGIETMPEEELTISVSSAGFTVEWNSVVDEMPLSRTIQILSYYGGWLTMMADEYTTELGVAMTWMSMRQWTKALELMEQYEHLVNITTTRGMKKNGK